MPVGKSCAVLVSYQTQGEVEQSRAAVEQDGDERGGGGEEEPHVSAHDHPQRLQDLDDDNIFLITSSRLSKSSPPGLQSSRGFQTENSGHR